MIKKNIEKIILTFISLSIITIFISSICITCHKLQFNNYSNVLYTIGIISLIFIVIYKILFKEKFKLIELIVIIMILLAIISTLLSPDINMSLFGFYGRNEGLFAILTYYILFILARYIKNDKYKKIIIYILMSIGVLSVIYGFFQITDIFDETIIYGKHHHAKAFLGNANSFGAFSLVCLFLSLGMYLSEHKKYYLIFIPIFLFGVCISGTMSSILAVVVISIALFIYLFIKNKDKRKKYIISSLIFIMILVVSVNVVQKIAKKSYIGQIEKMETEILNIAKGNINDSFGSNRIYIWKNALEQYPKYALHGIGIDRFYFITDPPIILPDTRNVVDKAHNEYLQILVTQGIFALITYLIFLILIIINSIKNSSKISKVILISVLAYLFQAFFNISITRLTPIIFILMGLMYEDIINPINHNIK